MLHCLNRELNYLLLRHIITKSLILFQLFLKIVDRFLFFNARRNRSISIKMTSRIQFEYLWSSFIINRTQNRFYPIWSHKGLLCINLASITHSLWQDINRDHMPIFKLIILSLFSQVIYNAFRISYWNNY